MEKTEKNDRRALIAAISCSVVGVGMIGFICGCTAGYFQGFSDASLISLNAFLLWTKEKAPESYEAIAEWAKANAGQEGISPIEVIRMIYSTTQN